MGLGSGSLQPEVYISLNAVFVCTVILYAYMGMYRCAQVYLNKNNLTAPKMNLSLLFDKIRQDLVAPTIVKLQRP